MQINEIISLIDKLNARLIVLLCHHNADPDAICAAYAFYGLLRRLRPQLNVEIAVAQGPSKLSRHLLKTLPVIIVAQPRIEEANLIVLIDTNTIQQLDEWGERVKASSSPLIVIDHHALHPETARLAKIYVGEEEASSTCEVVYKFFKEMKVNFSVNEAKALFLGIAFDTKHFLLADSVTFKIVAELVDAGVNAEEALSLLSLPMDFSERLARIKACKRIKLRKVNGWLLAFSSVSSYQASAARALIGLGAHVAVVAGQRGNTLKISLRSSPEFYKKTGIHLGRDIAKPLGEYIQGMGGGHSTSAGANGLGDLKTSFKCSMRLLTERFS